jgi:hypothetical protein
MENEMLEKRVEKHDNQIQELSLDVRENKINMSHIQEMFKDFKEFMLDTREFMRENILALKDVQYGVKTLNDSHEILKQEVCEIKEKVDGNEDLHKVDVRPITKEVISKILYKIAIFACVGGFFLYIFLTQ